MKTFAQASIIFMIVIITIIGCFNIMTGSILSAETDTSLTQSVEQALYETVSDKHYTIQDKDEFIYDFLINLTTRFDSYSDLDVRVLAVNEEEGLLDVEVTETTMFPDGNQRQLKCRRTVIFEAEQVADS